VCLRYGPFVKMTEVVKDSNGSIIKVLVEAVSN